MNNNPKIENLEETIIKLENVIGASNIAISAFSHKDAFVSMNPEDVTGALETMKTQLNDIREDLNKYVLNLYKEKE